MPAASSTDEPDIVRFSREIIDAVKTGRVTDRDQLQNLKPTATSCRTSS